MSQDFFENTLGAGKPNLGAEMPPHRGVDTSREAAQKLAPKWTGLKLDCLHAIEAAGDAGLTCDELAYKLRRSIMNVRPAVTVLANAGAVKDSGNRRVNGNTNKTIVWVRSSGQAIPAGQGQS